MGIERLMASAKIGIIGTIAVASLAMPLGCEKDKDNMLESNYGGPSSSGSGSSSSSSAWKKCCSCLDANECLSDSYSYCVDEGEATVNTECADAYCQSKCASVSTIDYPNCIDCGIYKNGKVYLDHDSCPSGMLCAVVRSGDAICMPENSYSYQCE